MSSFKVQRQGRIAMAKANVNAGRMPEHAHPVIQANSIVKQGCGPDEGTPDS